MIFQELAEPLPQTQSEFMTDSLPKQNPVPVLKRILAFLIDFILLNLLLFGAGYALYSGGEIRFSSAAMPLVILSSLVYFYLIQSPFLSGQSPGQRLLRLQCVSLNGTPPGHLQAICRGGILTATISAHAEFTSTVFLTTWVGLFYSLFIYGMMPTSAIFLLFDRHGGKTIHDLVAGTRIIRRNDPVPQKVSVKKNLRLWILAGLVSVFIGPFPLLMTVRIAGDMESLNRAAASVQQLPAVHSVFVLADQKKGIDNSLPFLSVKIKASRNFDPDNLLNVSATRFLEHLPHDTHASGLLIDCRYGVQFGPYSRIENSTRFFPIR